MKPTLTAVVITHNEEKNIDRCLKSLAFCDEIVVVDAQSRDRTVELALKHTQKVKVRAWTGYADQKNYANGLTQAEWILSVDADEEVSTELREEILEELKRSPPFVAYAIPRRTLHSGRWIRYGGWYPNRLVRLFKKSHGEWVGDSVHELWQCSGAVQKLKGDLVHHSFESISDQVARNNRYSTLGAEQLVQRGLHFTLGRLLWKPTSKFIETYFIKQGWRDGLPGFIICVSAAYSVFLKWAKLKELEDRA